jgi:enoyl-CoA hydratase/carnithine racemase
MPELRRLGIEELVELADTGAELPPDGTLLALDLTGAEELDEATEQRCVEAVRGGVAVSVGILADGIVPPLAAALDLTLAGPSAPDRSEVVKVEDIEAGLASIAATVGHTPLASYAAVSLARQAETLPVRDALVAESAAYSLLLTGAEFASWLDRRGPPRAAPPGDDEPRVSVARHGGELEIVLRRPRRRNAIDARARDELCEALRLPLVDPTVESVTISGEGPVFSSGGDLDEFGTARDAVAAHAVRLTRSVAWAIHRLRGRVTVRVHGSCRGAGVELASFAGRVKAAPGSTLGLPELALGLVPGAGGTVGITRRVGRARFAWLALSGSEIDAETALRWGLVDEVES